jgi:hypothetical protein
MQPYFLQTVIAVVWDFDRTLIPGYMQEPLFKRFNVIGWADDGKSGFWDEVNALPSYYGKRGLDLVSKDVLYLDHILTYVRQGRFPGLTNSTLRELGKEIEFYPGVPEIMEHLKARPAALELAAEPHGITVEHYIVSTGLRQMILGSLVAAHVQKVWACEFVDAIAPGDFLTSQQRDPPPDQPIAQVGYSIDNTTKTRAIFEINKGVNVSPAIDVNTAMAPELRRVPFQNMIYIADGPSDVPVFSIMAGSGGRTYAVYKPGADDAFRQAKDLQQAKRVQGYGPADFRPGTQTALWLTATVDEIAQRIAVERNAALSSLLGKVPRHLRS